MPLKFMVLMTSVLVVTAADGYAYPGLFDDEISRFVPLSDIGPETDNRVGFTRRCRTAEQTHYMSCTGVHI